MGSGEIEMDTRKDAYNLCRQVGLPLAAVPFVERMLRLEATVSELNKKLEWLTKLARTHSMREVMGVVENSRTKAEHVRPIGETR